MAPASSEIKSAASRVRLADSSQLSRIALPGTLLLCFVIAAGLGFYAMSYLRAVLVQERGKHLTSTAAAMTQTLDRVLFERYTDIRLLANESLIREGTSQAKTNRLLQYKRLYRYYSWLGLTDATGHLIASTDQPLPQGTVETIPEWHTILQREPVRLLFDLFDADSREPGGGPSVGFAAPIHDSTESFQGVVASRVPIDRLKPILEQESRLREGKDDIHDWLLLDQKGTIVIEKLPPNSPGETNRPLLRSSALAMADPNPGFVEEMDERRQVPVLTGYARTKGYDSFRGFDWIVLIRVDRAHAYAPIDRLVWTVGGIGLLVTVPLTGFGIWASWKLGREHRNVMTARQDLEHSVKELARSNAELQQFAYVASHDLQEPLRMVSSYTQLLAKRYRGRLDADADDFIGFAVDGAARMQKLIQDLLAYSRVGTRNLERQAVSMDSVLEYATDMLQLVIKGTDAAVTHESLPSIKVDERQMTQLFQNLISNAIKFRGQEPPRIHVSATRLDGEWLFSVHDNGIGIEPQYADRIFVIFQRLHNRDDYPGTGIGLAICKKIVERHGGRIWMESEPGKGSTFFFTVPDGKEPA
ncbi:MAG: ATP-binding protein [Nitrospira sp.]